MCAKWVLYTISRSERQDFLSTEIAVLCLIIIIIILLIRGHLDPLPLQLCPHHYDLSPFLTPRSLGSSHSIAPSFPWGRPLGFVPSGFHCKLVNHPILHACPAQPSLRLFKAPTVSGSMKISLSFALVSVICSVLLGADNLYFYLKCY